VAVVFGEGFMLSRRHVMIVFVMRTHSASLGWGFGEKNEPSADHEQDRVKLVEAVGIGISCSCALEKVAFFQQTELRFYNSKVHGSQALHVEPRDDSADVEDRVLFLLANTHTPSEAVQAWDALRLHVHAENPRKGNGGVGANEAGFDGVQDAAVVESCSGRSERMCLELDNTRFDIVGFGPAGLLVRDLRWVVAV